MHADVDVRCSDGGTKLQVLNHILFSEHSLFEFDAARSLFFLLGKYYFFQILEGGKEGEK